MRKPTPTLIAVVAAAAWLFGIAVPSMAPTARADALPNGYSVSCTQNGSDAICTISGCPRVHEDEAGDVVHTLVNGQYQQELSKGCGSDTTQRLYSLTPGEAVTLSVQGCRKHPLGSDDCGAWSDYKYTQPGQPAAAAGEPVLCTAGPDAGKKLPPGSTCSAAPAAQAAPVQCPAGSAEPTVSAGQQCAPPHDAVAMNITKSGLNAIINITNNSGLPALCNYTGTKIAGIGPAVVKESLKIAPNSTGSLTDMMYPPLGDTYDAEVECTATYNGQGMSIGRASQTVTGQL